MKFPIYRQIETMDCGPTCIRMISAFYGKKYSLQTLKEYCNVTRLGISIRDLVEGCSKIGLKATPVQIPKARVKDMPLPVILYWRQTHFVVLYEINKNNAHAVFSIADPSYGRIKINEEFFLQEWSNSEEGGVAILIEPQSTFLEKKPPERKKQPNIIQQLIETFFYKNKKKAFVVLLLSFIAIASSWCIPILFQKMIDNGIGNKNVNLLVVILIAQLMFFAGNVFSTSLTNIILTRSNLRIGLEMLSSYVLKLTKLPIAFFDTKIDTDLIQRMDDQYKIQDYMTTHFISFFFNSLNIIVFSAILLYYNGFIFLFYSFFSILALLWAILFINKLKILDYTRFIISAENKNNVYDLITGMTEIKINSAQHTKLMMFQKIKQRLNDVNLSSLKLNYYISLGSSFINRLKDILIIGCSAYFVITDHMSIGALISVNYVLGALSSPLEQMINFIRNTEETKLSYARLNEIQSKEDEDHENKIAPPILLKSGFTLSNVSFKYQGSFSKFVLKDVCISIPKGKITAIVGASGSGKTTLLKLLLSFYYPQVGEIYLGKDKFSRISADEWRKKCGVVMQDGYIFSGTIAENIALADEKPNMDKLVQAADIACISHFIESLPMKFNTKIGKGGMDVSGGQRQRILIARAVYKNPDFIFFDEATSSLDSNNEKKIMNNLSGFYKGKTVVIIAHRLSTVKEADNIILLDNGSVKEQGIHDDLIRLRGDYYALIKNQLELGT